MSLCASCLKPLKPRRAEITRKKQRDRLWYLDYTALVAARVVASRAQSIISGLVVMSETGVRRLSLYHAETIG
jgi:hypothetical protein